MRKDEKVTRNGSIIVVKIIAFNNANNHVRDKNSSFEKYNNNYNEVLIEKLVHCD